MSFSLDARTIPNFRNYAEAIRYYNTTPGDSLGYAPLGPKRRKSTRMYMLRDGSLACRYHATDVVTYHTNGSVSLDLWPSISTDLFANALLRGTGIQTDFNKRQVILNGNQYYQLTRQEVHLTKEGDTWTIPAFCTTPYRLAKVDWKKVHAEMKRLDFNGFKAWLEMCYRLGRKFDHQSKAVSVISQLEAGSDSWYDVVVSIPFRLTYMFNVADILHYLKMSIIKETGAVSITELPYCTDIRQVQAVRRSEKYL